MQAEEEHRYPGAAMLLHWAIAIAVIAQWRIAESAEHARSEAAGRAIMANHFSLGAVILVLVLLRLGWRAVQPNPPLARHLASWERVLSRTTHTLFYALLIALPLAGWLALSKYGSPVSVWDLVELPPLPVARDPAGAKAIFG
ncbi:MAG: cytochrome b, partial [Cypionkella sp.]